MHARAGIGLDLLRSDARSLAQDAFARLGGHCRSLRVVGKLCEAAPQAFPVGRRAR
jgi:hypothetical protein